MSILANILRGTARPAVMRPVPLAPAARSQAVQTLELRIREALPPRPAFDEVEARPVLMAVGRVRQSEDNRVAQLERELVMERMRTKELREQLAEVRAIETPRVPLLQRVSEFKQRKEAEAALDALKDSLYIGTDEGLKAQIREKVRAAIAALEGRLS